MSRLLIVSRLLCESLFDGLLQYRHYERLRTLRVPHSIALNTAMADRPRVIAAEPTVTTKAIMSAKPAHA
jgi:hypothetical protein